MLLPSPTTRLRPAGPAVVNGVYARALRNCPWVGTLWGRALRALERFGAPDDQHAALWEKALATGLQVRQGAAAGSRMMGASGADAERSKLGLSVGVTSRLPHCLACLHLTPAPQSYEDYCEVVLARLDCLRRRGPPAAADLRAAFKRGAELLQSYFPDYVDRTYRCGGSVHF